MLSQYDPIQGQRDMTRGNVMSGTKEDEEGVDIKNCDNCNYLIEIEIIVRPKADIRASMSLLGKCREGRKGCGVEKDVSRRKRTCLDRHPCA